MATNNKKKAPAKRTQKPKSASGKESVSSRQANLVKSLNGGSVWGKIAPWIIGFIAFLFLLCLLFSDSTGAIGPVVSGVLRGLFSGGAYPFVKRRHFLEAGRRARRPCL